MYIDIGICIQLYYKLGTIHYDCRDILYYILIVNQYIIITQMKYCQ